LHQSGIGLCLIGNNDNNIPVAAENLYP